MKIAPIDERVHLVEGQSVARLGPPRGMSSFDCETIDVIRSSVVMPSGVTRTTTVVVVELEDDELERLRSNGGRFWISFLADTFPPLMLGLIEPAPEHKHDHERRNDGQTDRD